MKLRIFVNPSRLRRWHLDLAQSLEARGHLVRFAFAEGGPVLPLALRVYLRLECGLGARPSGPGDRVGFDAMLSRAGELARPDIIIDLTAAGSAGVPAGARTLRLLFYGSSDESAAMANLCSGRMPRLTAVDVSGVGVADRVAFGGLDGSLSDRLDQLFAMATDLLLEVSAGGELRSRPAVPLPPARTGGSTARMLAAFALSRLLHRLGVLRRSG